jgi:predicted amidohydrolase YtcJ
MLWVHNAVNHSDPAEALTVFEAMRMCTYNGYYTSFDEDRRGSLEVGKIADMAILSGNPYTVPKERLKDLKVEQTILAGKPYRPLTGSPVPQVLRGMLPGRKC